MKSTGSWWHVADLWYMSFRWILGFAQSYQRSIIHKAWEKLVQCCLVEFIRQSVSFCTPGCALWLLPLFLSTEGQGGEWVFCNSHQMKNWLALSSRTSQMHSWVVSGQHLRQGSQRKTSHNVPLFICWESTCYLLGLTAF